MKTSPAMAIGQHNRHRGGAFRSACAGLCARRAVDRRLAAFARILRFEPRERRERAPMCACTERRRVFAVEVPDNYP